MGKINREEDPEGVLVVDKGKGMTSHDVVDLVRRRFGIKKAGHAGTLDPNATGVLVLLLGGATKFSDVFLNQDKEYLATMKLGERTDSGDADGKITAKREVDVTAREVMAALSRFKGEIDQVPPMFSAKRHKGKKLYELARKGIEVKREPRRVTIKEIKVEKVDLPMVVARIVCSKGTFIRQLADDIGESLGTGAYLVDLRRTRSGDYDLSSSVSTEDLCKIDREKLHENISRIQGRT